MQKIIYYILYVLVYIFSLIPLRILYLFTDIVWLLMYLCPPLRYRRKIVRKNLVASFPKKSLKQIRSIERRFYRNFLDQILESLKVASMSERWIERHVEIVNYEKCASRSLDYSVMVYMGHMGGVDPLLGIEIQRYGGVTSICMSDISQTAKSCYRHVDVETPWKIWCNKHSYGSDISATFGIPE